MLEKYKYLLGKSKAEVLSILGEEFNFYPSNLWDYKIHRTWWGKEVILYLVFEDEMVFDVQIKISYWKFK